MGTRAQAPDRGHVLALDGVRGVAILTVVLYHLTLWANVVAPWDGIWRWTKVGHVGVDLFFVLSGYLITGILWDSRESASYLRNFYARRFLRIFPLYYAFVLLIAVVAPLLAPGNLKLHEIWSQQLWLWTYTSNVVVAIRNQWTLNVANHLWSLAVEEQFYLVWPLIVWRLRRETIFSLCFALTVVTMMLRWLLITHFPAHDLGCYTLTLCRMDALLLGAALALEARAKPSEPRWWASWSRMLAIPAATLALSIMYSPHGPHPRPDGSQEVLWTDIFVPTCWAIAFAGLVSAASAATGVRRFMEHRVLRFFGRYSYGIYVFHFPLHVVFEKLVPLRSFASPLLGVLVFAAVGLSIATGVAWISFHAFESRFLALKGRFAPSQGSR
jgi:peptidoglycan/LPS O-acetylase OafA/YrhL